MLARSDVLTLLVVPALLSTACAREAEPETPSTYAQVPYAARAIGYRLPVEGEWKVHRTHYGAKGDQAFALDLVVVDEKRVRSGGGKVNSDFFAYGKPIVADAEGVVIVAVDGVPDNVPGRLNRYDQHGNYVVIDHRNGEYSLFAHLMPGSIKVRVGQFVAAGTELGRCGNSGHSSMPHLHWQVMSGPDASSAEGLPPRYVPYRRNGQLTVTLPDKGDTISNN